MWESGLRVSSVSAAFLQPPRSSEQKRKSKNSLKRSCIVAVLSKGLLAQPVGCACRASSLARKSAVHGLLRCFVSISSALSEAQSDMLPKPESAGRSSQELDRNSMDSSFGLGGPPRLCGRHLERLASFGRC